MINQRTRCTLNPLAPLLWRPGAVPGVALLMQLNLWTSVCLRGVVSSNCPACYPMTHAIPVL